MKASSTCLVTKSTNVPPLVLNARLEHYFEMSKVDATEALRLYRRFCKQAEKVVEFLGVAKKLQNLLNVPIPTRLIIFPMVKFSSDIWKQAPISSALWKNT